MTAEKTVEPLLNIKARIARLDRLPTMPAMALEVIQLSSNPEASINDLVKIVEMDPSLAAQIMRYASSPFFSYRGKIDSVQTAVSRVLGFSMVMNLALGVTTARPFKLPKNVPLSMESFWRHAVFSAALTQALSSELADEIRPPAGLAYLAGLLHNFGHILIGHLFRKEFLILNKFIIAEPETDLIEIEKKVFGYEHGQIGAWLMDVWKLPEELIVATREHNNLTYQGEYSVYPQLVALSDRLLKEYNIGDAPNSSIPQSLLQSLGIGDYQARMVVNRVMEGCDGLDIMARQLAS
ncbi:MAG: HDOD domain-containing protein [Gammaproteobacteria bacterium]|nr:HDOD domain-containing protein [Gammaproteobacteria bacterium]